VAQLEEMIVPDQKKKKKRKEKKRKEFDERGGR
jgi:hypothetical protein